MKVLMLTPSYFPIVGGTENVVKHLAVKLNKTGIHTDVMTFNMDEKWKPVWREEVIDGDFKVFRMRASNIFRGCKYNPLEILFNTNVIPHLGFTRMLKDYDILHFHDEADLSFPFFSYFVKRPKILHCHTLGGSYWQYRGYVSARRTLMEVADFYICISNWAKRLLLNLGLPESRIFTLYNGVNTEKFKPDRSKKADNLVLCVGRLRPAKRLPVLLDSLKFLKIPCHLTIIGPKGDPRYFAQIFKSIEKLKKESIHEIELLGKMDENELIEWYQKASIFVSTSPVETLGMVNLEALSCGTPVVAPETGGSREIVKNEVNGILVPQNDPEKLARALRKLLENKKLREEYGRSGREMVEKKFSLDSISKQLIAIYEKICENRMENRTL